MLWALKEDAVADDMYYINYMYDFKDVRYLGNI